MGEFERMPYSKKLLKNKLELIKEIYIFRLRLENKKKRRASFFYFKDIYGEMCFSDAISHSELRNEWRTYLEAELSTSL